jgi:hypothetical protein
MFTKFNGNSKSRICSICKKREAGKAKHAVTLIELDHSGSTTKENTPLV